MCVLVVDDWATPCDVHSAAPLGPIFDVGSWPGVSRVWTVIE